MPTVDDSERSTYHRPDMGLSETFPPDKHRRRKKKAPAIPARTTSLCPEEFPVLKDVTDIPLPKPPLNREARSARMSRLEEFNSNSDYKKTETRTRRSYTDHSDLFVESVTVISESIPVDLPDRTRKKKEKERPVPGDSVALHKIRPRPSLIVDSVQRVRIDEDDALDVILIRGTPPEPKSSKVKNRASDVDERSDTGSASTTSSKSVSSTKSANSSRSSETMSGKQPEKPNEQGVPYAALPPLPTEDNERRLRILFRKISSALLGVASSGSTGAPPPVEEEVIPSAPNPKSTLRRPTRPVSCHSPKKIVTFSDRTTFYAS